jgi:hypothetical protein
MITTSLVTSTAILRRGSGSGYEQTTMQRSMFCPIHTVLQDQQRNVGNARNICLPYNLLIFLLRYCQQATEFNVFWWPTVVDGLCCLMHLHVKAFLHCCFCLSVYCKLCSS